MEPELPPEPGPALEPIPEPILAPTPDPVLVSAEPPVVAAPPPPDAPAYRDRSTGLMIFGVVQIILGALAALMVPLVTLGAFVSRFAPGGGAMRPGQYISGVATYAFIAAGLITLGIGSVQSKRWARALTLVISWYWMIMGVLVTVLLTAVLPVAMRSAMAQAQPNGAAAPSGDVPTGVMAVILTLIIVFCAFFLIVVPIAFIAFYGRKDVAQTCHDRDPVERWTDRAPLPVLGASVVLFTGALYLFVLAVTTPLFPFFGKYLTGIPGAACFFILAALDFYLAIALFRLQSVGWWIAAFTVPLRLLSLVLTYTRADLMQAYSKVGLSEQQVQLLRSNPMFRGHVILWWSLISIVLFFGYLLWLKRYFKAPVAPQPAEAMPAQLG